MNCIVYQHKRLDTNEIFYIGIGKKISRAYSKSMRNQYWKNIVNKTEYSVEILHDNLTWEEACNKEKDLIKLYGRKDLGLGLLVNMTDGGNGRINYSEDEKARYSERSKYIWSIKSEEEKMKSRIKNSIGVKKHRDTASPEWKLENNKKTKMGWMNRTELQKEIHRIHVTERVKNIWKARTPDEVQTIANKISQSLKGKYLGIPKKKGICPWCQKTCTLGRLKKNHFENCINYGK